MTKSGSILDKQVLIQHCKVHLTQYKIRFNVGGSRSRSVFYECSNYEYGCKHQFPRCDNHPGWIEDDY